MECFVLLFQIYSKYSSFMKPFFESGNSQIWIIPPQMPEDKML
jgi:hypothetical protein